MDLDDRQAEIGDIRNDLAEVTIALENAESCETEHDFNANVEQALEAAERLVAALKELKP
jgi:hypothetical protein